MTHPPTPQTTEPAPAGAVPVPPTSEDMTWLAHEYARARTAYHVARDAETHREADARSRCIARIQNALRGRAAVLAPDVRCPGCASVLGHPARGHPDWYWCIECEDHVNPQSVTMPALTTVRGLDEQAIEAAALHDFRDYVRDNYGEGCVLSDPQWHAPKWFRAAIGVYQLARERAARVLRTGAPAVGPSETEAAS